MITISKSVTHLFGKPSTDLKSFTVVYLEILYFPEKMVNFTKDYETIQAVACTASLQGNHYIYSLTALNILLAITASLGNALILVALSRNESALHPPSKLMFRCLTVTDLGVGVFSQPVYVIQLMSIAHGRLQLCYTAVSINDIAGSSFSGVSLLTLTAISLDRLLGLCLGLRYKRVVTLRRTLKLMISFWILIFSICFLRCFCGKHALFSSVISVVIYSSLAISAFSYLKIYLTLRHRNNAIQDIVQQDQPNNERGNPLNIARYRKAVSTALCVQLALVACYLPYGIVVAVAHVSGYSPSFNLAVRLTITLVVLNSSLNPILYCWKMRGVSQAVKDTITKLFNQST